MGKLIYDVSMSLDGFITGEDVRPEAGLGDASPSSLAMPPAVRLPPLRPIHIRLPAFTALLDPAPEAAGGAASSLVVDDDPHILLTLRAILEFEGYPVETAGCAAL